MSRLRAPLLFLCCTLALCLTSQAPPGAAADVAAHDEVAIVVVARPAADRVAPPPKAVTVQDVKFIRDKHKNGGCRWRALRDLSTARIIAAAEVMLANSESDEELAEVFGALWWAEGDRRHLVTRTVRALRHTDREVRGSAARLLGEIGSRNEALALVAMLSDEDYWLNCDVVEALACIGGPNELIALDNWIRRASPKAKSERIAAARNHFAARLIEEGQSSAKEKP
jgi:HEAT repeat protein